jgi:nucleoside-diphosphate-sugar epimerase
MKFTILGSSGFIGRRMVQHLRDKGFEVNTPDRDGSGLHGENLGHVIYAIGMTGDFRSRLGETIDAHVSTLQRLMNGARFESWLYLSSTRVYNRLPAGTFASEDDLIPVRPDADSVYNLSKLLGEALCLAHSSPAVRVARLSNVYGEGMADHNFLGSLVADAAANGKVVIGEGPQSAKDYVSIDDVVRCLENIAMRGRERMYNVASGRSITHAELAEILRGCGYDVQFSPGAGDRIFPEIDMARMQSEFPPLADSVLEDLPRLVGQAKSKIQTTR